ncbi:sensor histidine kinase [Streptomyces avicenniae]|uniref:sensor histidine kinase n=1 Tax=Streptomyces avicenniae TaxID=500153 RepID=UPI00069A0F42|nr:sensor histidine kinase [Streptomyces avicenniae]
MRVRPPPEPPGLRRTWLLPVLVLLVQQAGSRFADAHQTGQTALDPTGHLLLALGPLLLAARYRRPGAVAVGTALVTAVYLAAGYPLGPVFLSVVAASFHAVVAGRRYAAWSAMGALWIARLVMGHWLHPWLPAPADASADWGSDAATAAWTVAVLSVAELVRLRRERHAAERAERQARERRRADEERLRVARELHDVLAHSIAVINVQAAVGLALLDSDPAQARTALLAIRSAGKDALGEVRQVLDTLRAPGAAPRAPTPGLADLPELAAQAAAAGLRVHLEADDVPGLPPAAGLTVFRVTQEALTNIVRHSGARTARVRLRRVPGALDLRIEDAGPATGGHDAGSGNGLTGMRERAAACGGTLTAGPVPGGGFRVEVRLPLAPPAERPPGPAPDPAHAEPAEPAVSAARPGRPE